MNKFLLILLLGMVAAQVSGQQFRLFQDSVVYVWAEGGLNMRDAANLEGERITTIPYGAEVKIGEGFYPKESEHTVAFYNGKLKLTGGFVKVTYQGAEGYVFSGYLSIWPALKKNRLGQYQSLEGYIEERYELLGESIKERPDKDIKRTTHTYSEGMVIINSYDEKTGGTSYWLPGWSFTEGILLFKMGIFSREMEGAVEGGHSINMTERKFQFEFSSGIVGVTAVPGGLIITISRWC